MFTDSSDLDSMFYAELADSLSPEDYEKMMRARYDAFGDIFKFFSALVNKIFKRKVVN